MQPKKAVIENFRAHEEDYGIACTEFAKAYVHLSCALKSADYFTDIFKKYHVDMGEVKRDYKRCLTDMEQLAKSVDKHLGMDTKALLGKVFDDTQQEIENELNK